MANAQTDEPTRQKPLRLWPGVVAVMLQWLARFGVPIVVPGAKAFGVFGGLLGGLAIVVWWAFFSRAPRSERWGAVVLMIVALVATPRILHESIATGMMGLMFVIYAIPVLSLAFVVWAVVSRRLSDGPRRAAMVATILLACGVWTLVRSGGISGDGAADFAWRWAETPEERFLAQAGDEPATLPSAPAIEEIPEERFLAQAGDEPATLPSAPAVEEIPEERFLAQAWRRAGDAPVGSGSRGDRSRLARLSRTRSRRDHSRCADRDRLVSVAAGRAVAPADRTGLVFLRSPRRLPLHPGAAR